MANIAPIAPRPCSSASGQYWFGQILPDLSVTGGINAAVAVKSTRKAASAVTKYDAAGYA